MKLKKPIATIKMNGSILKAMNNVHCPTTRIYPIEGDPIEWKVPKPNK